MSANETALLLKIKGDASQLKSELGGASRDVSKFASAVTSSGTAGLKGFNQELVGLVGRLPVVGSSLSGLTGGVTSLSSGLTQVTGGSAAAASGMASLAGPMGAVAGIALTLAGAEVAAATELFNLTKATAQYDGQLKDLNQQSGISVGLLSTLKLAAENSGSSIEAINTSLIKYLANVSDANHRNEELEKKFRQVGFTAKELNEAYKSSDDAIRILVEKIGQLNSEEDRNNALKKLGIRNTKDFNAVVNEMKGDLDSFRESAEELGLIITPEQAKEADKFNDSLHILELQLKSIGYTIGREVMPVFQEAINDISKDLKDNKDQWAFWGEGAALWIRYVIVNLKALELAFKTSTIGMIFGLIPTSKGQSIGSMNTGGFANAADTFMPSSVIGDAEGKKKGGADKARQEQIRQLEQDIKQEEELHKKETDILKREYDLQLANLKDYTDRAIEEENTHYTELEKTINKEIALAKKQSERDKYTNALQKARDERDKNTQRINDEKDKKELDALVAHNNALLDLQDEFSNRSIATIRSRIELQATTEEKGEQDIADIEREMYKRRWDELIRQREELIAKAGGVESAANQEELQRIKDQIRAIEEAEKTAAEARERRIREGIERDTQRQIEAFNQLYDAEKRYHTQRLELERQRFEQALLFGRLSMGNRAFVIATIAKMDIDAIYEEAERNKRAIDEEEARAKDAAKKTIQDKEELEKRLLEIHETYQALRELEDDRARERDRERQRESERDITLANNPFLGGLLQGSEIGQITELADRVGVLGAAFQTMGGIAGQALDGLAQGIGAAVQNWVLLGNQADFSMKKLVATVLAGVAAQAATQAVYFTAIGIAALTPWGAAIFGPATQWFIAAGMMASIALGAGLAGRAVAGNSFQNQGSSRAVGGASSGISAGGRSGNSSGGFYSGNEDSRTIEQGRNQLRPQVIILRVESNDSHIVNVLQDNVNKNGRVRDLIVETVSSVA